MEKYNIPLLDQADDESRKRTLDELSAFVYQMGAKPLTVVTLDDHQSANWDQDGDFDYQDYYGQQIISQLVGDENDSLVIRNADHLPVAMAMRSANKKWKGIGIDKRLRGEIKKLLNINESELE